MQRQHSVQATAVTSPIVLDGFAGEREKQLDLLRTTVLAFRRARNAGPVSYTHLTLPTIYSV